MVSVIIPIYNTAKYLRECVDSIINQTYRDIEVILVDDGSPDEAPEICDWYAAKDDRVIVIHKPNGGLSDARNAGILRASGEYIYCIDSDDYLDDLELFEKIIHIYQTVDTCIVAFSVKFLAGGKITGREIGDYHKCVGETAEDIIYNAAKSDKLFISACEMFIRRDFIINHNLFFKKGIKSEDIERGFRLYACSPKVVYYERNPYIYRQREGSITATIDYPHLLTYTQIVSDGIEIAETCTGKLRQALLGYAVYHASIIMGLMGRVILSDEQTAELDEKLKPICKHYLRKYALGKKARLVAATYTVLHYTGTKKLLGTYLNRR